MARNYSDRRGRSPQRSDVPDLTSESESDNDARYSIPHYSTPKSGELAQQKDGPGTPERPIRIPDAENAGTPDEPIWISDVDGTDTETDTSNAAIRGTRKPRPATKVPPSNAFAANERPRSKSRERKASPRRPVTSSSQDEWRAKRSPARKKSPTPASADPGKRSPEGKKAPAATSTETAKCRPARKKSPFPASTRPSKNSPSRKKSPVPESADPRSPAAVTSPRNIQTNSSGSTASSQRSRKLNNAVSGTSEDTPTTSNHVTKKNVSKPSWKSKSAVKQEKQSSNPFDIASLASENEDPMLEKELEEIALNGRSGMISGTPSAFDIEKGKKKTPAPMPPAAAPLEEDEADRSWHTPLTVDKPKNSRRQRSYLVLSVFGLVAITGCLIYVLMGNKGVDEVEEIDNFEDNLTNRQKTMNNMILRVTDEAILNNANTPQHKARQWLLFSDREIATPEEERVVQRYALASFYFSTGGDSKWNENNWLTGGECKGTPWKGLDCNDEGQILALLLDNEGLTGTMPLELGHLSKLEHLILKNNPGLFGWIPTTIGHVKFLSQLGLYENALSGTIPDVFQHASQIRYINLEGNNMYGSIPLSIKHLTNLDTLALAKNRFDGMVPVKELSKTTLKYLSLSRNEFSSMLEHSIREINTLEHLYLDNNKLRGPVPREIVALTNLRSLDFGNNQFTGTVPTEIGELRRLEFLSMSRNQLRGALPRELIFLTNLKALNFASNQLVGTLPNISNMARLVNLQLFENKFTGSIPESVQQLQSIEVLSLSSNNLAGTIPRTIARMSNTLRGLYLSDNGIKGRIPTELCQFDRLEALFLDNNDLFGPIPPCLGDLSGLQQLYLFQNGLTGQVPSTFEDMRQLKGLGLEENGLTGEMPDGVCTIVEESSLDIWADCTDQFGSDPLLCDCCTVCCPSDACK